MGHGDETTPSTRVDHHLGGPRAGDDRRLPRLTVAVGRHQSVRGSLQNGVDSAALAGAAVLDMTRPCGHSRSPPSVRRGARHRRRLPGRRRSGRRYPVRTIGIGKDTTDAGNCTVPAWRRLLHAVRLGCRWCQLSAGRLRGGLQYAGEHQRGPGLVRPGGGPAGTPHAGGVRRRLPATAGPGRPSQGGGGRGRSVRRASAPSPWCSPIATYEQDSTRRTPVPVREDRGLRVPQRLERQRRVDEPRRGSPGSASITRTRSALELRCGARDRDPGRRPEIGREREQPESDAPFMRADRITDR